MHLYEILQAFLVRNTVLFGISVFIDEQYFYAFTLADDMEWSTHWPIASLLCIKRMSDQIAEHNLVKKFNLV